MLRRWCALGALVIALAICPLRGGAQVATPSPNPGSEPLINAKILGLPADPAIVALVRFTFAPGAVFPEVGVPGPAVYRVVEGNLNVRFPGEPEEIKEFGVEVTSVASGVVPAVATPNADPHILTVSAGEQMIIPADIPHEIRNDSTAQTTFYAAALTALPPPEGGPIWPPAGIGPDTLPSGITAESLDTGYKIVATLPPSPIVLTLDRLTLPPGAALPDQPENALTLFVLEEGAMSLTGDGEIAVRRGARGPVEIGTPEANVLLAAGDSALAQPGTSAHARNTGDAPLVLVELMLVPATAGTPEPGTATPT
jgi:quercetin dioxygenase-like cupin family protein